ncbi:MAG: bifunctional nuclease family protein [Gemmatimonadota bacterium]
MSESGMVQMEVVRVQISSRAYHRVVLREKAGNACLHIVIGPAEARAIAQAHDGQAPARPLSYDMACALLEAVSAHIQRVEITDLQEGIYYALVHLEGAGGDLCAIDSRPSDAIALALRAGAPIFAAATILEQEGSVEADGDGAHGDEEDEMVAMEELLRQAGEPRSELDLLRQRLRQAVAEEAYEEAARLRDQIAGLETSER